MPLDVTWVWFFSDERLDAAAADLKTDASHSGTARTGSYGVDAALML